MVAVHGGHHTGPGSFDAQRPGPAFPRYVFTCLVHESRRDTEERPHGHAGLYDRAGLRGARGDRNATSFCEVKSDTSRCRMCRMINSINAQGH